MKYDVIVVGAGIVGLSTCLKLFERNPALSILLLEKEKDIALHQSSHNSGVIHSGIYYKPGSLKARNCRRGYGLLLDFCDRHAVEYEICGKVIVAVEDKELPYLDVLYERGRQNGLTGLRRLSAEEIKEHEPHAQGVAGIFVPQTGIIDFAAVSNAIKEHILGRGAQILCNEEARVISAKTSEITVETNNRTFRAKYLVTCGGLQSDRIAHTAHPDLDVRIIPFRGEYYKLKQSSKHLVRSLIYPVPDPAFPFLGVHFTRMINGGVEAGPNAVLAFKREGYRKTGLSLKDSLETFLWPGFHKIAAKYWRTGIGEMYRSMSKRAFVKALQRLVPEISAEDLEPGGAGVRAQACARDGALLDDFYFVEGEQALHVCNAPSPAATSALAIGEYVAAKVLGAIEK